MKATLIIVFACIFALAYSSDPQNSSKVGVRDVGASKRNLKVTWSFGDNHRNVDTIEKKLQHQSAPEFKEEKIIGRIPSADNHPETADNVTGLILFMSTAGKGQPLKRTSHQSHALDSIWDGLKSYLNDLAKNAHKQDSVLFRAREYDIEPSVVQMSPHSKRALKLDMDSQSLVHGLARVLGKPQTRRHAEDVGQTAAIVFSMLSDSLPAIRRFVDEFAPTDNIQ